MKTLEQIKAEAIIERLLFFKGNRALTAKTLSISSRGLRNQLASIKQTLPELGSIIPEGRDNTGSYFKNVTYGEKNLRLRAYRKKQTIEAI